MTDNQDLAGVRERIDELDKQIQSLISERAACAKRVAEIKNAAGEHVFYRPEREAQVLRAALARNEGALRDEHIVRIFREIMSACLALEQPLSISFLGPEGTFTQEAMLKHFGHAVTGVAQVTVEDVFRDVESGRSQYGVVPVENSTEGSVARTLDMFLQSPLKICGEVELRVRHQLLGKARDLTNVRRVYGHQQALAQCRNWLEIHLKGIEQVPVSSNAEAAKRVSSEADAAAIASEAAAEFYKLNVLRANIEDAPDNTTRFLVINDASPPPSGDDKTSLLIMTGNQPGALYRVLSPLQRHGISMTRIESRPSRRGTWDYAFFVDLHGHEADTNVAVALVEVIAEASTLKVLGAYPRAVL